jgi:hypothetical protein
MSSLLWLSRSAGWESTVHAHSEPRPCGAPHVCCVSLFIVSTRVCGSVFMCTDVFLRHGEACVCVCVHVSHSSNKIQARPFYCRRNTKKQ